MSTDPQQESTGSGLAVSRPILIVAAVIAITAAIAIGWVVANRGSDDSPPSLGITSLDLAAPLPRIDGLPQVVHLVVTPVRAGVNDVSVVVSAESESGFAPAVDAVTMTVEPLAGETPAQDVPLSDAGDEIISFEGSVTLEPGWTEVTVTVERPGDEPRKTLFYLLAPDPNVNGFDAVPELDPDTEAEHLFEAGLNRWANMRSLKYIERLTSGQGTVSLSQREVSDGSDGNPPASRILSQEFELLTIGDRTWQRPTAGEWIERERVEIFPPSEWTGLYDGATSFALGKLVTLNGRRTQVLHFSVPPTDQLAAAWYTWWVDTETGYVVREAMVSTLHYMVYEFGEFDKPLNFETPSPQASPVA